PGTRRLCCCHRVRRNRNDQRGRLMSATTETTTTQPVPTMMSSTSYESLIARLDLPSKVRLLTGASMFTLAPEPSVDLAEVRLSDGPTGVRGLKFSGGRTVALFPNATLLAST